MRISTSRLENSTFSNPGPLQLLFERLHGLARARRAESPPRSAHQAVARLPRIDQWIRARPRTSRSGELSRYHSRSVYGIHATTRAPLPRTSSAPVPARLTGATAISRVRGALRRQREHAYSCQDQRQRAKYRQGRHRESARLRHPRGVLLEKLEVGRNHRIHCLHTIANRLHDGGFGASAPDDHAHRTDPKWRQLTVQHVHLGCFVSFVTARPRITDYANDRAPRRTRSK